MERVTVSSIKNVSSYADALGQFKIFISETGMVDALLQRFIVDCLAKLGIEGIHVPETDSEVHAGNIRIRLRPRIAIIEMDPPDSVFRSNILNLARDAGLVAVDHQNGYLFVPAPSKKTPWWKFW